MGFEQQHNQKIEQPKQHGDRLPPQAGHDEVHQARRSAARPEKPSTSPSTPASGSLEMSNPYPHSHAQSHSGFPGGETRVPSHRDGAINNDLMQTSSKPMSDSQFQPNPRSFAPDSQVPTLRDTGISKNMMKTSTQPMSDTFQHIQR
jgi:hypothetical protein